jgi:hypothetical protein
MPLAEIMQGIETDRFASEINLAAGTRAFHRCLRGHELFRQLTELVRDAAARRTVARRVEDLAVRAIDDRYENRFDAALSAYLIVLGDTAEPDVVLRAAEAAATARNTWWTVGVSRDLIAHAVATGATQAPAAAWHFVPAALAQGLPARDAANGGFHKWWVDNCVLLTARENAGNKWGNVWRAAEGIAQVSTALNPGVIPPTIDEGERVTWKARARSRTARNKAALAQVRGRKHASAARAYA